MVDISYVDDLEGKRSILLLNMFPKPKFNFEKV